MVKILEEMFVGETPRNLDTAGLLQYFKKYDTQEALQIGKLFNACTSCVACAQGGGCTSSSKDDKYHLDYESRDRI